MLIQIELLSPYKVSSGGIPWKDSALVDPEHVVAIVPTEVRGFARGEVCTIHLTTGITLLAKGTVAELQEKLCVSP